MSNKNRGSNMKWLALVPQSVSRRLGLGALLGLVAGSAAADDLSTGVVTAITGTNPQITAVVTAMAGALVLILAWTLIKKAMH